jgi:DAACS family dicarboxylate/amino acid:cation (Na+ or H+) symporter
MTTAGAGARRRAVSLPLQMLGGLLAGATVGLAWPPLGAPLQPLGTAFIEAIKMIVMPLVFSAVALGVYRMGTDLRQLGRVAAIAFAWFFTATFVSILIALALDAVFHPGAGADLVPTGKIPANLAVSVDWVKYLIDLIPSNVIAAMAAQRSCRRSSSPRSSAARSPRWVRSAHRSCAFSRPCWQRCSR